MKGIRFCAEVLVSGGEVETIGMGLILELLGLLWITNVCQWSNEERGSLSLRDVGIQGTIHRHFSRRDN
jgi:hypothetical protein